MTSIDSLHNLPSAPSHPVNGGGNSFPSPPTPSSGGGGMNGNNRGGRPSDPRREALAEALSIPTVSNFFPIDRYYEAADKVYTSFQSLMSCTRTSSRTTASNSPSSSFDQEDELLDEAYVLAKRYCHFVMDAIPHHDYYKAAAFQSHRMKHGRQLQTVIEQLEEIVKTMDAVEEHRQQVWQEEQARRLAEATRKQQERFEEFERNFRRQKQLQQQQQQISSGEATAAAAAATGTSAAVETSALSKLKMLEQPPVTPPSDLTTTAATQRTSRYRLLEDEEGQHESSTSALPPPILPPGSAPPPPSYQQIISKRQQLQQQQNNNKAESFRINGTHLVSDQLADPSAALQQRQQQLLALKRQQEARVPMRALQTDYQLAYIKYLQAERIKVYHLSTYQGRMSSSTNGCTVISALVAATHLNMPDTTAAIPDAAIEQIIDRECGPFLRQIRSKVGLGGHALIIPSDVHDHLVDAKILHQEKFVGAAGGNIIDPQHLGQFLQLLSVGEKGQQGPCKGAATLFFREHVISIVKTPSPSGQVTYYDLIDSLAGGSHNTATRTRCQNLDALQVLLNWYTSRKFSPSDCSYVDRTPWDDNMADVDPRVFQGFVWSDPAPPGANGSK